MAMQLVERTVETLRTLGSAIDGLTLAEVAEQVGMPASSMHRLLATLVGQGMVLRHPDKRYTLGPEALVLARGARSVEKYANEGVRDLASRLDQTAFLSRWTGRRVICTSMCAGGRALRLFVEEGQELPIHAAASARIIAAYAPREAVHTILESSALEAFTSHTPTSPQRVMEILELDRARGYDVSYDELDHGVLAVSVPVWQGVSTVTASVTIAGPVAESEMETMAATWTVAALRLARELSVRETGPVDAPGDSGTEGRGTAVSAREEKR